jgi:hypothetical protein
MKNVRLRSRVSTPPSSAIHVEEQPANKTVCGFTDPGAVNQLQSFARMAFPTALPPLPYLSASSMARLVIA